MEKDVHGTAVSIRENVYLGNFTLKSEVKKNFQPLTDDKEMIGPLIFFSKGGGSCNFQPPVRGGLVSFEPDGRGGSQIFKPPLFQLLRPTPPDTY